MAEVTVNRSSRHVFGDRRVLIADIDIAADADTYTTNLSSIDVVLATSVTNNAIGATVSGGVVTLQTAGAEAGAGIFVVGKP